MRLNAIQYAYVTRNLDKAIATLQQKYGYGDFIKFDVDGIVRTPEGSGRAQSKVAMVWDGDTQIEIIQPVAGLVDLYYPYMPEDDSMRFHHSAVGVDDWKAFTDEIARKKSIVAYGGELDGLAYVYLDERETFGHYVEYLWCTDQWWKAMGRPGY
jgi:hypothetical protein